MQDNINQSHLFVRSEALWGKENLATLSTKTVMVLGLGGVGGHCSEALLRAGVKKLYLVDKDVVDPSNINRQLLASYEDIGRPKVDVALERFSRINPFCELVGMQAFYLPQNPIDIPSDVDLVLDCIDTMSAKIHLWTQCAEKQIPLMACMGMGNRFSPEDIAFSPLSKTQNDPLSKVMRKLAKERNLANIFVVYSKELPQKCNLSNNPNKATPGSLPFVPSVGGLVMAAHACEALIFGAEHLVPKFKQMPQGSE